MRPRIAASAAAATACILIIGWQAGTQTNNAAATTATILDTGRGGGRMAAAFSDRFDGPGRRGQGARGADMAAITADPTITAAAAADGTFVGPPVPYPRGSVSVGVTVTNGVITNVDAALLAQNPVSRDINQRMENLLGNAVLAAQSTDITMISGATYTSQAYAASLQAALDEATS
ncbi:FMN-binding protein [Arthrobacter agilis]|uniref:FMN-binding protein n=1 Tax=Arthrobacter agilis TaxID=37921 RepID=UPI002782F198|nr:FMN-binding protein [Arthrobacter agilis]MDQ0734777.1 uncharacterized protein with FMN-binding domain [Arthrobacter agilis]